MFLQIISFHTDRFEEFAELEREWQRATDGTRTTTGSQVFADRDHPGHYVALDWFTDYESAMVNSALPATSDFAARATSLGTGPTVFHNLEPVTEATAQGAAELRQTLETSTPVPHAFTDDVEMDMIVPHGRLRSTGREEFDALLKGETKARAFEVWDVQPTPSGFTAEYAYRTLDDADTLSVGALIATVREGRIARLYVTCGGNWSAETQAQVAAETGELGPRLAGSRS